MKKTIISTMKKAGEKVAEVPITNKCWPVTVYQPKMPAILREKMKNRDQR